MCLFQRETGHILETVGQTRPRLLLITNRKWHTLFQMKWKSSTLDDLKYHWQPLRSAILTTAAWASCLDIASTTIWVNLLWRNIERQLLHMIDLQEV